MGEKWLSTSAAARMLGVTRRRVLQLIQVSLLPAQRMGRDWFIVAEDIANFRKLKRRVGRPKKEKRQE